MAKRTKTTRLIGLSCATLVWVLLPPGSSIPTPAKPGLLYQGRTIEDWVSGIWVANKDSNPEIQRVVAIGTPAVPHLVRRLEAGHSRLVRSDFCWKVRLKLPARLQGILSSPVPLNTQAEEQELRAVAYTVGLIGPDARQAVPVLIQIAKDRELHSFTRELAVWALGQIGPPARRSVPTLVNCLKDDHQRPERRGWDAAVQLTDPAELRFRACAARSLARIGVPEPRAIPPLQRLLSTKDAFAHSSAAVALWRMDPCQSNVLLVSGLLQSPDPALRRNTAVCVGQVGEPAACFVSTLQTLLGESNGVSAVARLALGQIQGSNTNTP